MEKISKSLVLTGCLLIQTFYCLGMKKAKVPVGSKDFTRVENKAGDAVEVWLQPADVRGLYDIHARVYDKKTKKWPKDKIINRTPVAPTEKDKLQVEMDKKGNVVVAMGSPKAIAVQMYRPSFKNNEFKGWISIYEVGKLYFMGSSHPRVAIKNGKAFIVLRQLVAPKQRGVPLLKGVFNIAFRVFEKGRWSTYKKLAGPFNRFEDVKKLKIKVGDAVVSWEQKDGTKWVDKQVVLD